MKNRFLLLTIIVFNACFFIMDIFPQDFQVSSHSSVGFWPHMATDSSGNFVIVWDDYRNVKIPYGGTGSDGDIYGRRYNKTGTPIGDDFRISDDSINTDVSYAGQIFPRISMNKSGRSVVTWEDTRPKGTPSDGTIPREVNIYAQMLDLNGKPVGANFMVNDTATSGQLNPDVIVRDDGSFVIIWNNTLDKENIYLQVFDSNGNKISSNKKLSFTGGQPRIALFENGNYIVTGDSNAQIYSFPSEERGLAFDITAGYMREIKISKDDIIYATHSENQLGTDQFVYSDIFIEAYDTLGNTVFNKIMVNDDGADCFHFYPTLSLDKEHLFVAWQDYRNVCQIGDIDIYGQRFDLNLSRIGTNFKVSHDTNGSKQRNPTFTLLNDTIYIAWFDARKMEYYTTVEPPISKIDVWATIQNFNNPIEGEPIRCTPHITEPPISFNLFQSFPNPTQAISTFKYDLPEDAIIKLNLYNILGEEVKTLINEFQTAGYYSRSFAINDLSSGVYFARIVAETSSGNYLSSIIKVVLIK